VPKNSVNTNIIAQYGAFVDDAVGADDEEDAAAAEDVAVHANALSDAICDAQRDCECEKEKAKFERVLEDHKKLLYPTAKDGQKKAAYNT